MNQLHIFVSDKCEINVDKKLYSEPNVDLHKLRKCSQKALSPNTYHSTAINMHLNVWKYYIQFQPNFYVISALFKVC